MGKIQVLPDELINVIAAGEVVERPASVVKELLENSIDAESTRIEVTVQKAGKVLIRVVDDGVGMSHDDAFLALERHATSKIKNKDDLFKIHTMGFRGEAIPSIAAVSKFTMITKERDSAEPAVKIYCEGGRIVSNEYIDYAEGTLIEVKNLFYNVPARRRQLSSDNTEFMHIVEMINRLALANPEIHFSLIHNNREALKYLSRKRLVERVMDVFSLEFSKNAIEIDYQDDYMRVSGYISQPEDARKDWHQQYVFVNRRYVASRIIRHAIDAAYDTLLPRNRYPKGVIFIDLDPAEVDVNVHPTKIQVRFLNTNRVHDTLTAVLRQNLIKQSRFASAYFESREVPEKVEPPDQTKIKQEIQQSIENFIKRNQQALELPEFERKFIKQQTEKGSKPQPDKIISFHNLEVRNILGQILDTYIVVSTDEGFALIDQHAAHERVRYERFLAQYSRGNIPVQELLMPINVDVTARERVIIDELTRELEKFGFEIEFFGNNVYAIKAIPSIIKDEDVKALFYEIVDEYVTGLKRKDVKERVDELIKLISCKGAIKANQRLTLEEMKELIEQLLKCESPFTCPHGRPTIVVFNKYEIEKLFKRVM